MKTEFFDRQDLANLANATTITSPKELRALLVSLRNRAPFFAELIGGNGFKLLLGLGGPVGCAQFSSADGEPPYYMAVSQDVTNDAGEVSFLIGDTASPVPRRYCLPSDYVVRIAEHFLETGQRSRDLSWEEI